MDKEARGAIIGMVFGDAYVNVRKRFVRKRYEYESSEIRVLHSIQQKDYCEYKAALVRKYFGGNFSVKIQKNGQGGKFLAASFSASNPYFRLIKKWTYPFGKKTFTKQALDFLTHEGIAIWYMDDGHARRNYNKDGYVSSVSTSIATMCSKEEVDLIIVWFLENHSIHFKARFDKRCREDQAWFIECNTENSRLFAHLVRPYMIDSMLYKLAHVADLSSHECRDSIGACVHCGGKIYDARWKGLCASCYSKKRYREARKHLGYDIVRPYGKKNRKN